MCIGTSPTLLFRIERNLIALCIRLPPLLGRTGHYPATPNPPNTATRSKPPGGRVWYDEVMHAGWWRDHQNCWRGVRTCQRSGIPLITPAVVRLGSSHTMIRGTGAFWDSAPRSRLLTRSASVLGWEDSVHFRKKKGCISCLLVLSGIPPKQIDARKHRCQNFPAFFGDRLPDRGNCSFMSCRSVALPASRRIQNHRTVT